MMREEIRRDGLLADQFLGENPNVPTFGLNLACAWPFPEVWRAEYERLAGRLAALGPWLYVYPFACTHVTLVTFIGFSRHVRPAPELVKALESKPGEILAALAPLFAENTADRVRAFALQPQSPVLSRDAVILPLLNPGDEVARLRQRTEELLQGNEPLHRELTARGLNVPGIIHSTVARFLRPPPNLKQFLAAFDEIAGETKFAGIEVGELLLTSETQPYMRGGEILRRFNLTTRSP